MELNLKESEYALSKIMEVLMTEWQEGVDYDALKEAADRHIARIKYLEIFQKEKVQ